MFRSCHSRIAMSTEFPFEFRGLEGNLAKKFPKAAKYMTFVGPKKYGFPENFQNVAEHYYNLKTRPSDVWIYGYPRSGTTMLQEITWLIGSDLDYEKASRQVLDVRFPFLEKEMGGVSQFYDKIINNPSKYDENIIEIAKVLIHPNWVRLENQKDRRFVKTHIPISLGPRDILESGCKIFYMARNPKDVIISNFHLFGNFFKGGDESLDEKDKFEQYWEEYKRGLVVWTPYFEHLKEGWEASKSSPNVLFLFYEDYKKDMRRTLIRIANHLNRRLTNEELDTLEEHLQIDNFRKNYSVNNDYLRKIGVFADKPDVFIRKGKANGWKDFLTDSISADMDRWIQTNLKQNGLEDFEFPKI